MVARGAMLGADQPVILHLLDIEPAKAALEGVKMELLDAAFPLLQGKHQCARVSDLFRKKKHKHAQMPLARPTPVMPRPFD